MKLFTQLVERLSFSKDSISKSSIIRRYFESEVALSDKDCALKLLLEDQPKRVITTKLLTKWIGAITGYPRWLIDRSEREVGNFVQTFNLLLRTKIPTQNQSSITEGLNKLEQLRGTSEEEMMECIADELTNTEAQQRLILLKLMTGTFKSPVSRMEIITGLALAHNLKPEIITLRLYACEKNSKISIARLKHEIKDENRKIAFEFPQITFVEDLNDKEWQKGYLSVIGKKDGIEAQLIKHQKDIHLWTRTGEIVTEKFPEITSSVSNSDPDCKLYGQILPKNQDVSVEQLSKRFRKKSNSKKDIENAEAYFEIYEVLESHKQNIQENYSNRTNIQFAQFLDNPPKKDVIALHRACRNQGFTGLYLKPKEGLTYYYWKADSLSVIVTLMHVEFGSMENSGIRSLTLGVYKQEELVPIAKINSFDKEIDTREIIQFVKENTIERFGPVRTVKPKLVYQLIFDGISKSSRRKSGFMLANPKILKMAGGNPVQANTLDYLKSLFDKNLQNR